MIPIGVAIATTIVINLTVGPRLAARGKRIQSWHDSRDKFTESILDLLALCLNLQLVTIPESIEDSRGARVQAERDRWEAQIGEITIWLMDHWQRYVPGYVDMNVLHDLVTRYVADVRGVWISGRPLEDRVRILKDLTEPMQTIFLGRRWRPIAVSRAIGQLRALLDNLEDGAPIQQTQAAPQNLRAASARHRADHGDVDR
jgi:hypothetical protein